MKRLRRHIDLVRSLIRENGIALVLFSVTLRPPLVIILNALILIGEAAQKLGDRIPGMERPRDW